MIREVDLSEISDGKKYRANDMVKVGTGGCAGCSRCCRETEDTILLDPLDVFRLCSRTGKSFAQLLEAGFTGLRMADGLILPHLGMRENNGGCMFLDETGRCSIHDDRPGFCRLFPLGRVYEGEDFYYFLQVHECSRARVKMKVSRWLEVPDLPAYEEYIRRWHAFCRSADRLAEGEDENLRKTVCTEILRRFFLTDWESGDFYPQFEKRLAQSRQVLGIAQ